MDLKCMSGMDVIDWKSSDVVESMYEWSGGRKVAAMMGWEGAI